MENLLVGDIKNFLGWSIMKIPKFKFRIGSLLVLVAFVGLSLGWWADRVRRQPGMYLHLMTHANPNEPSPPKILCSMHVVPNQEFRIALQNHWGVSGMIKSQPTGGYHTNLSGQFRSGFAYDGTIELDKLTDAQLTGYSGVVQIPVFVFTRSPNFQEFLDKQDQRDNVDRKRNARQPTKGTNK